MRGFKMSFSDEMVQKVWEKGAMVQGVDQNVWRKDACGAWINRSAHTGKRENPVDYEWEIDHINPNGGDDISNLRPLQWKNNLDKAEERLTCSVTSDGNRNVLRQ
jgi:hypothetical protein